MRLEDQVVLLKKSEIDAIRRQIGQIEMMIEEFNFMIVDLDQQIEAEHRRTGIKDNKHPAYSTVAHAAVYRRQNLQASVTDLQKRLTKKISALDLNEDESSVVLAPVNSDGVTADRGS